jgi:hypothetical protein
MKKIILVTLLLTALFSCSNNSKDLDILKLDLKNTNKLSQVEIDSMKFKILKMTSSDGKKELLKVSNDRKRIVAAKGGLYAFFLDVCKDSEIKDKTDVNMIEAYRIVKDTVFKKLYFTNENKVVGKFLLK